MPLNPRIPNIGRSFSQRGRVTMILSCACVLAGCAAVPAATPYGNHAVASTAFDHKVAGDAIKQLAALYPPASTRFNLTQSTADAFGTALVTGLREKGYALMESKGESQDRQSSVAADAASSEGLELRYLLDRPSGSDLYRLTLAIGNQRLSRPYMIQSGAAYAAGAWVRKE